MNTYDKLTQNIIDHFSTPEQWRKLWKSMLPMSLSTERTYKGVNVWNLSCIGIRDGHELPLWGTYQQMQERGLQVKTGEKASIVVYWTFIDANKATAKDKADAAESGEVVVPGKRIPILKAFNVFNVGQCNTDGDAAKIVENLKKMHVVSRQLARLQNIDEFAAKQAVTIKTIGSVNPCYSPSAHEVRMPLIDQFESTEEYYRTLFHELVHSTMAECGRAKHALWGDERYAAEELVAELGSAMLCNHFGIDAEPSKTSIGYLQSWARMMGDKPKAIMQASAKAQQAVTLMLERWKPTAEKAA